MREKDISTKFCKRADFKLQKQYTITLHSVIFHNQTWMDIMSNNIELANILMKTLYSTTFRLTLRLIWTFWIGKVNGPPGCLLSLLAQCWVLIPSQRAGPVPGRPSCHHDDDHDYRAIIINNNCCCCCRSRSGSGCARALSGWSAGATARFPLEVTILEFSSFSTLYRFRQLNSSNEPGSLSSSSLS